MPSLALLGPSWPLRGGIARTTTALAAALDARGALAGFLVPARQYPRVLYPGAHDVDPDACARLELARACFGVLEPWSWPALAGRVRALAADALVMPYWTAAWAPVEAFVGWRARVPRIAIVHNPADHGAGPVARRAARAVLGGCAAFLCHSRSVADAVAAHWPGKPATVHPLPSDRAPTAGDRERARARFGLKPESVAALCFGLVRPYKGVEVVLDAVASLPLAAPITLLLAGEPWGALGESLARRVREPELAGRVVARLAWIPEAEVADWFAAADVAVLPYLSATGSAVAAQAIGRGLPIVGSAVGGIVDVVEDGVSGLLVEAGRADLLAAALARVCDPEVRARLAAGTRAAAPRWSWASYAAALEVLVEHALAARAQGERGRRG